MSFEDETRPLLSGTDSEPESSLQKPNVSLPWPQVASLFSAYFAETVVAVFAYPFLAQLIASLDVVEGHQERVGYFMGVLDSVGHLTTAFAVLLWGRFSDEHGRKPVLLACSAGLAISVIGFGYSKTYTSLVFWKAFQGIVKGNKPIVKTAAAELAEGDEAKMARLFGLMPAIYAVASTIGPLIGGTFAEPYLRFPQAFGGQVWRDFPYLLPCLVAACSCLGAFFVILLVFKETLPSKQRHQMLSIETPTSSIEGTLELHSLMKPTRRLVMVLLNYALLVILDLSFNSTFALFLSLPINLGGLAFSPHEIGLLLGFAGFFHGLFQAFFFAHIHTYWEPRNVYAVAIAAYIPIYLCMPFMNALARSAGQMTPVIWILLVLVEMACTFSYTAFSCMYIFITQASPSPAALGRTHAAAQTVFSLMGAVGPAVITSLVAVSIQYNILGGSLAYIVMAVFGLTAVGLALRLPIDVRRQHN